ncbi:MAG: type II toxin-antitoxin system PemK/MazF family toxin [Alcanivoracaceae bacterium]|nr:type II toxin-antitoxin system PemK/MazF family toxin [Alcanivoracaceae bacterium]
MAITFHPRIGQILLCDFSQGFKEPEMVKNRPVVVITPAITGREKLVTVLALSTKKPVKKMPFHYKISKKSMPQLGRFQENDTWVKGDMIYTIGFHRLNRIMLGKKDHKTGKRIYFNQRFGREQMKEIYRCTLHGINLGELGQYI